MEITHLSKTSISMYQRCPFSYKCRYVDGLKMPPSSSLVLGSSFDKAINLNYETKIKRGSDEKVSTIQDCFAEAFDNEKGNAIFEPDEKPEQMKDNGVKTVKEFHTNICPQVEPIEVQKRDSIKFENVGYELMVVVDVVDKDGTIIDNKTTKRKWSAGKEFSELDPVIYSLWYEVNKGEEEKGFRFDIGVIKNSPEVQQIERKVTTEEKLGFLKYMSGVHDSIQNDSKRGLFLPRPENMMCSKRYCGYHEICSREYGIKIKD